MSKDPAFLFYPGDYLQDTQCLNENAQVAYDRIMCEHMRNIRITQQRLNFFTKRLSEDEKSDLMSVLCKEGKDYYIEWVNTSLEKRRAYSESRRHNRENKPQKHMKRHENICEHMEIANEIVIKEEDIEEYVTLFLFWEQNKKGGKYKNKKSRERMYNKLVRLTNYNFKYAKEVILHCIDNNYQGFCNGNELFYKGGKPNQAPVYNETPTRDTPNFEGERFAEKAPKDFTDLTKGIGK